MAGWSGEIIYHDGEGERVSGFVYHGALGPLDEALKRVPGQVSYVSCLLDGGAVQNRILRKFVLLWRHVQFAFRAFTGSSPEILFIRDFSNIPLLMVFPLLRRNRARMWFLVNHNLQWTFSSRLEKAAFSMLGKQGCQFVYFEQVPSLVLSKMGIDTAASRALFHPVPETSYLREPSKKLETIGIIGQYRPEKGTDDLLEQLEPLAQNYRVVLALPNLGSFRKHSRFGGADWITCMDTTRFDDYLKVIAECDVIVLNHSAAGYEYRASGLIADAAAAHVPVVIRRLPTIEHQIEFPCRIGETYGQLSELQDCIVRVADKLANEGYAFPEYKRARSGEKLSGMLTEIIQS